MKGSAGLHPAINAASFVDATLTWGGRKIPELAEEIGGTPFFVYSRRLIDERIGQVRAALPERLRLYYAVKANPMPEIVEHMATRVDGFDIASAGELALVLANAAHEVPVSFAGPGKRDSELIAAVKAGATVSLESAGEMRRLAAVSESLGRTTDVVVRINPPFELAGSGMKMGGRPSQFGIDAERIPGVLKELAALRLPFRGFHVYAGSQSLDANSIAQAIQRTARMVVDLAGQARVSVSQVNLGGGFGIPYFAGQMPLSLAELTQPITEAIEELDQSLDRPEVILELGRYLVGEAGIYVCRVIDVKESRGRRFVVVDGGMHQHLAASGNLGQVIRRNYPLVGVRQDTEKAQVTVVGPLCTPLDILGDQVSIDQVGVGSLIAVLQSGAYGRTASPEGFLGHPPAREIVL